MGYYEMTPETRRKIEAYNREHAEEIAKRDAKAKEEHYQNHLRHCHTNVEWMLTCLQPKATDSDETLKQKGDWLQEFIKATMTYAGEISEELQQRNPRPYTIMDGVALYE
jgi:hypothetical protein